MTRPRAVAALAAGTLALITAGATPAAAERWNHHDARHDVVSLAGPEKSSPAPRNRNADVTRVVVRHSPNRVILRTHLRDLNRRSGVAFYEIDAAGTEYSAYHLLGTEGGFVGRTLDRALGRTLGRAGSPAPDERFVIVGPGLDAPGDCPGAWQFAKRRRDVARISIPRSCLGNPKRVRAGVGVISFDPKREREFADDGLRRSLDFKELTLSPWVRRGPVR